MKMPIFVLCILLPWSFTAAAKDKFSLGSESAPVTLTEYGSLTCDHCIHFHREVLPRLKSKYITTEQVRFVFRDFPTSDVAHRGAVAARCAGTQYYEMLDILFEGLANWVGAEDIDAALTNQAKSIGIEEGVFRRCLASDEQKHAVSEEQRDAKTKLGVIGTPTFLINDKLVRGKQTFESLERLLLNAAALEGQQ